MKTNKSRTIFIIIFILIYALPILSEFYYLFEDTITLSNPFDYARITDVDYKAIVVDEPNSQGKVVVTEKLTYDIHAASRGNLFWELWRDLPEEYIDGLKTKYKVNSVKQVLENGKKINYLESSKLYYYDSDYLSSNKKYGPRKWYHSEGPYNEEYDRYECVFFYVDGLYREKITFEIEYEMTNAALKYNDCSELYLCLFSENSVNYLKSFKGQILFKNKDMPSPGNYYAHTYGTNSNEFPFKESDTINPGYHTFLFELDELDLKFRPYNEYIEFSLVSYGDDKHIFTQYAPRNNYTSDNVLLESIQEQKLYEEAPQKYKKLKLIVFLILIIIAISIIIKTTNISKKIKKKYDFFTPTMKMDYFREIPSNLDPTFASFLVFSKDKKQKNNQDGYSALMLSLVRKGYIELVKRDPNKNWISSNINIVVKYNPVQVQKENLKTQLFDIPQENLLNLNSNLNNELIQDFAQNPIQDTTYKATHTILSKDTLVQEMQEIKNIQENNIESDTVQINYENNINNINETQEEQIKLEPLTLTEKYYFDLIVRHSHGTEISADYFQSKVSIDYENTDTFVKNIELSTVNIGIAEAYFQRANYDKPKQELKSLSNTFNIIGILLITLVNIISYHTRLDFAFGAFFILGIVLIINAFYIRKLANKAILLTQYGEDEYVKWRGLYNFLNSETLMKERTVIELPIWEQYLVYATAFGISDKVIKALNIRCPEIAESPILSNPYYRSTNFYSSGRSFRSITRSASHTARSGGYGGGFGYGGGGRGGGGGGGGH